jgi:hypothetical protein
VCVFNARHLAGKIVTTLEIEFAAIDSNAALLVSRESGPACRVNRKDSCGV